MDTHHIWHGLSGELLVVIMNIYSNTMPCTHGICGNKMRSTVSGFVVLKPKTCIHIKRMHTHSKCNSLAIQFVQMFKMLAPHSTWPEMFGTGN